jgi:hypothetical protein
MSYSCSKLRRHTKGGEAVTGGKTGKGGKEGTGGKAGRSSTTNRKEKEEKEERQRRQGDTHLWPLMRWWFHISRKSSRAA